MFLRGGGNYVVVKMLFNNNILKITSFPLGTEFFIADFEDSMSLFPLRLWAGEIFVKEMQIAVF